MDLVKAFLQVVAENGRSGREAARKGHFSTLFYSRPDQLGNFWDLEQKTKRDFEVGFLKVEGLR